MTLPDDPIDALRAAAAAFSPASADDPAPPLAGSTSGGGGGDDPPPDSGASGDREPVDWGLVKRCAREPDTDIGNGRRLLLRYRDRLLWVSRIGWHVYDGRRWAEDVDHATVRPLAHRAAEAIALEARFVGASEAEGELIEAGEVARAALAGLGPAETEEGRAERKALADTVAAADKVAKKLAERRGARLRFARTSAGSSRLSNMLAEAAPYVAKAVESLNADPLAFNCLSGTLRFVEDLDPERPEGSDRKVWQLAIQPHRREDLISKLSPVAYDPFAEAPRFNLFLKRVLPDPEVRAFLQRFMGLCLTGLTREQVLVFFHGSGRNGKSTFVDLVARVIGDYAVTLDIASLSGEERRKGSEATPDLARLPGARLVRASEPELGVKLKEAMVKTLTAGEPIAVRRLHQEFIEVYPAFKLVLSGNHKPIVLGDDEGIWRRVLLVPWEEQIPKDEVDTELPARLWEERAGVLAWLVDGALDYLNSGLRPPGAVTAATQEYREESDPIGAFVRAACAVTGDPSHTETPGALYAAFEIWAKREGAYLLNQATFTKRFAKTTARVWPTEEGGVAQFYKAKSYGATVYRGLRVRADFTPPAASTFYGGSG